MKPFVVFACAMVVGCTFGGSNEDPRAEVPPLEIPDTDAAEPETVTTPDTMDASFVVPTPDAGDAAVAAVDARTPQDVCEPGPEFATCDPVTNTGCPPLTQCDVDSEAAAPTGRCVFYTAPLDTSCSASAVSTTCEGGSTCVSRTCRTLCRCDSDCGATEVCDDVVPGTTVAIKLCRSR